MYRKVMLILILPNVQYLQNVAFSFEKVLMVNITPSARFPIPPTGEEFPPPLNTI